MKKTSALTVLSALLLIALSFCIYQNPFWHSPMPVPGQKPPNFLLITADDLGTTLSCYGYPHIQTPNIDQLAKQGVRFENAYVAQASCSPSRAALLTGKWPHQVGQLGLAHMGFTMSPGQDTLPAMLKDIGYTTGIIGKIHVAPVDAFPFDWMPEKEKTAPLPTQDVKWVAQQARLFFDQVSTGDPFFFYVNYFDPHLPFNADNPQVNGLPANPIHADQIEEPIDAYPETLSGDKRYTAGLFNAVMRLDAGVGLLMEELDRAGIAENTVVIFVSDNGMETPRSKASSYEEGVRVPMIVRWPGVASPNHVIETPVSLLDIAPTLLTAAGAKAPADLAGLPLQILLGNAENKRWRPHLFTEMNFHTPTILLPQRTVRDDRYKLILNLLPGERHPPLELYDLWQDPTEKQNLADSNSPEHAQRRRHLSQALEDWRYATHDPLMEPGMLDNWQQRQRQAQKALLQGGEGGH